MRLRFWKRDEDYPEYYPPKKPRKKQTSSQLADEIIVKAMKADPLGYGLDVAERLKGIRKDKSGGLGEFRELADTFGINLKDLGKGGKGQGSALIGAISSIPEALSEFRQMQAEAWERQKEQMQLTGQQPQQPSVQQLKPTDQLKLKPSTQEEKVILGDLVDLIELEPESALELLKDNKPWMNFLRNNRYEKVVGMMKPFAQHPEFGSFVQQMLEEKADWLKKLTELAHNLPME